MLKKSDFLIYLLIFAADLISIALNMPLMEQIVKPLIMIWIVMVFIRHANPVHPVYKVAVTAFVFSLIGDVVLILPSQNGISFIAGMGAFLVSQLFFIVTFYKTDNKKTPLISKKPFVFLPVILVGVILYILLFPHLDFVMKIAVFIYAAAITGMLITAINRKGRVDDVSFKLVFVGALLFFLSDSLLAINKFWFSVPAEGIIIMSTYMAAQFLIMLGLVKQSKSA